MRLDLVVEAQHVELGADRRDLDRHVVDRRVGEHAQDPAQAPLGLVLAEDGLAEHVDVEADALAAPAGGMPGQAAGGCRQDDARHLGPDPLPHGRDARRPGRPGAEPGAGPQGQAVERAEGGLARSRRATRPASTAAARSGSRMRSTSSVRARMRLEPVRAGGASGRCGRARVRSAPAPPGIGASASRAAASCLGGQKPASSCRCRRRGVGHPGPGPGPSAARKHGRDRDAYPSRRSRPPHTRSGPCATVAPPVPTSKARVKDVGPSRGQRHLHLEPGRGQRSEDLPVDLAVHQLHVVPGGEHVVVGGDPLPRGTRPWPRRSTPGTTC